MANKLINTIYNQKSTSPPIWFMRQAGRYMKEYRKVRAQQKDFLTMCYNPKVASDITLQPIDKFDFDAAIIFSDILVIPDSMGQKVSFKNNVGPLLNNIDKNFNFNSINQSIRHLEPVFESISLTRSKLSSEKCLIGFAGAPWTILTYMLGNNSKDRVLDARVAYYKDEIWVKSLIENIVELTSRYLIEQIKYGAQVVKLFDSWSGCLSPEDFFVLSIEPTKAIVKKIKEYSPQTPVIGFPKGSDYSLLEYAKNTNVDCLAVDWRCPLDYISEKLQPVVCVQGNLDPAYLVSGGKKMINQIKKINNKLGNKPFVANLGHGINKFTPEENVKIAVETFRQK